MQKFGNAIPCKYDLTFTTARKTYWTIHCFEYSTITKIDHRTAFSHQGGIMQRFVNLSWEREPSTLALILITAMWKNLQAYTLWRNNADIFQAR